MNYKKLNAKMWSILDPAINSKSGFKTICLADKDDIASGYHIFLDELGDLHLGLAVDKKASDELIDPGVSGIKVEYTFYNILGSTVKKFIDISCFQNSFVFEFTALVKEILRGIYVEERSSVNAVNITTRNFKAFWANNPSKLLSEDKQVGLICELLVLKSLCEVNPEKGIESWKGPLKNPHDFVFKDNSIEVKGTRGETHTHTINGLSQLEPLPGKDLFLFSYLMSESDSEKSVSLQSLVEHISGVILKSQPDLSSKFFELLAKVGYSPVFEYEYRSLCLEIVESNAFHIDDDFPCLSSSLFSEPILTRIKDIYYRLILDGLSCQDVKQFDLSKFV